VPPGRVGPAGRQPGRVPHDGRAPAPPVGGVWPAGRRPGRLHRGHTRGPDRSLTWGPRHGPHVPPGGVHIPRGTLESSVENRITDKSAPVIIHCASGVRSVFAAKTLSDMGYQDVVSVSGGLNKWKDEGRGWAAPRKLSAEQRNRYQRHLLLPEVDVAGQLKLLDARVLLLGAGGPGSPGGRVPGP